MFDRRPLPRLARLVRLGRGNPRRRAESRGFSEFRSFPRLPHPESSSSSIDFSHFLSGFGSVARGRTLGRRASPLSPLHARRGAALERGTRKDGRRRTSKRSTLPMPSFRRPPLHSDGEGTGERLVERRNGRRMSLDLSENGHLAAAGWLSSDPPDIQREIRMRIPWAKRWHTRHFSLSERHWD